MKNGNMPAAPIFNENGYPQVARVTLDNNEAQCSGLTKREYFAGLAPQIPEWFENSFKFEEFKSPLTDDELEISRICDREQYDDPNFDLAMQLSTKLSEARREHDRKKRAAMYFGWRVFYADALLAELEKSE